MNKLGTREYIDILRTVIDEGKEVNMRVLGSSMAPFVVHERDTIYFKRPERKLKKGDIAFFQRNNGQYVVHRIYKVKGDEYYFVGDNQTLIEGPIEKGQIFAIVTRVIRKGKEIRPGDPWWLFFQKIWINMIPLRRITIKAYGLIRRKGG